MAQGRKRLVLAMLGHTSLLLSFAGQNRSAFEPADCQSCEHNHANFSDDFDKSGHCYMFRDRPTGRCGQHRPCARVEERR